jgi:hypothetical protein
MGEKRASFTDPAFQTRPSSFLLGKIPLSPQGRGEESVC